jgi:hypothetical protein
MPEIKEKSVLIEFAVISDLRTSGKRRGRLSMCGIEFTYELEGYSPGVNDNVTKLLAGVSMPVVCSFCGNAGYEQLVFDKSREGIVMSMEDNEILIITIDKERLEAFRTAVEASTI